MRPQLCLTSRYSWHIDALAGEDAEQDDPDGSMTLKRVDMSKVEAIRVWSVAARFQEVVSCWFVLNALLDELGYAERSHQGPKYSFTLALGALEEVEGPAGPLQPLKPM